MPWRSRLKGALWGLVLITVINTARIGTLSVVVGNTRLFETMHYIVWPAVLIIVVASYVFWWVASNLSKGEARVLGQGTESAPDYRERLQDLFRYPPMQFLLWTVAFVVPFVLASGWYLESSWLLVVARWAAIVGGVVISALGATATVSGNLLSTAHGGFLVTPSCMASPLIPVYYAAVVSLPMRPFRRLFFAVGGPPLFFLLGTLRLLVLALPAALISSHSTAIHAFNQVVLGALIVCLAAWWHYRRPEMEGSITPVGRRLGLALGTGLGVAWLIGRPYTVLLELGTQALQALFSHPDHDFLNPQGATTMLPAYQLGLLAALCVVAFDSQRWSWHRTLGGFTLLVLSHPVLLIGLGELWSHGELAPHVRELRAWAVAAPVLVAMLLYRQHFKIQATPSRAGSVPNRDS